MASTGAGWRQKLDECLATITRNLQRNHLWQRMLKNTVCTTIILIIGITPAVVAVYGPLTHLGAMVTVFGHPGRRFGELCEALILIILGAFVGMAWSSLGLYLSSLVVDSNLDAACGIRAIFFALAVILHGVLRSSTPRLFLFVFLMLAVSIIGLTGTATSVSTSMITQVAYPILTAAAVVIVVNVSIFPELSSDFLGISTIETLFETVKCLQDAEDWFISESGEANPDNTEKTPPPDLRSKLVSLTDKKGKLRSQLGSLKTAQAESNFELVFAVLPPRSLKRISVTAMTRLVQTAISLVNACESKYALAGDDADTTQGAVENDDTDGSNSPTDSSSESSESEDAKASERPRKRKSKQQRNLELIKPIREIESGDSRLLEHILTQVRDPAKALHDQIHRAVQVIAVALAHCYDVSKLPSGVSRPDGIIVEEIDVRMAIFADALSLFDLNSAKALENAAAMAYRGGSQDDIMPGMEIHLISSFLTSTRDAAAQVLEMLRHSRALLEKRDARSGRRRFYFPKISWDKWLTTGGESDASALPENARKAARTGRGLREDHRNHDDDPENGSNEELLQNNKDEETGYANRNQPTSSQAGERARRNGPRKSDVNTILWLRGLAADAVEFFADSDDLAFALKMTFAAFLVTWPAFVPEWNAWYRSVRGSWASLQLIIVFEVAVGASFHGFFVRAFGVVFGCVVGFLSYLIGQGNHAVAVMVLALGAVLSFYVQLSTGYVKTGIISTVSMSVVGLGKLLPRLCELDPVLAKSRPATAIQHNDHRPWEIFVQRLICFLVGGAVALMVEMFLFPVRARDRLVESLASSIQQISHMEASLAIGIDSPINSNVKSHAINAKFHRAKGKAEQALSAARTFLPFCLAEPRLKGSFKGQTMIYREMIFVLFQIIERMDNVLHLRNVYGTSILEELSAEVLPYRRNVAGSIAITLFAVHEALTTRLPLPQFLPSSRVAQLRVIRCIRESILKREISGSTSGAATPAVADGGTSTPLSSHFLRCMTKQTFLSWNAASAGIIEIIEYLEELVDLAKLLVGVNAFRSGMLERPNFQEHMKKVREHQAPFAGTAATATATGAEQPLEKMGSRPSRRALRRRAFSSGFANPHHYSPSAGRRDSVVPSAGNKAVDAVRAENEVEDDLPVSLQRVRTKRMEEREFGRLRRASTVDPKGKGITRASTWVG
ncbi:hypothetical protein DL764_002544 [Monosporascus ibericus]|uniref:Uncharacterized protein n=1 Tax=Monosporascus ibericus TaxID=155417 RepID=A0A4V1XBT9_9PEZI|nr:hypothetical protein DL764_002544 [Monosporascus ibericus]